MIVYFSDRQMQVLGLASTNLHDGYVIKEDLKTEDVESGVATFSCRIGFNDANRLELERMTEAGNYLLRSHDNENEFYTIIETEIDTKNKTINIYAEDAGLDLLNEIAGEFEATESHTSTWYIEKYIVDSGFEIGINEIPASTKRKLKWEGEETVTSRLASIATQFGGYEISYSFDIKGLVITNKYVNIHKMRGKDIGITLRLNQDIDKIVTTKTVANLATAFVCEGGVPDNAEEPITLKGYTYDDGDFYVDKNGLLKSRKAVAKWSRYVWNKEPNRLTGYEGHIVRPYSYNTTDQKTLCSHAVTELKKICDMEVNYEIDIRKLPDNVKIGDRINIVDDAGELYVSTRILMLETSIVDQTYDATLGEHLIKTSGISQKVIELAEQFSKASVSAARALSVANTAKTIADAAQTKANEAAADVENAQTVANEAKSAAETATASANEAANKADAAQSAVDKVESSVSSLETTVENARVAAENAQTAANEANTKADEAKVAAGNAETKADEANIAADDAKTLAEGAETKADAVNALASEAKTMAQAASDTAAAAKADSEQAKKDVDEWAENLETYKKTVTENYARKTDLTETTASLQAQITANANQLEITHSKVLVVDETANNAKELAEAAQATADDAQAQADQATADAEAAQTKADQAKSAADAAQTEANNAKAAADAAQGVADKAEADLATAKADLATVSGRVDATEEEIAAAQQAVDEAQAAADKANADAATAAQKATDAQTTANTAVTNAANAQSAADDAASKANLAQLAADEAKGDASAAQATADEAKTNAANAQATANTAVSNAAAAQAKADQAAQEAANAQQAADDADAKAAQAQTDLNAAKQNLENVTSRVGATEADIAEAEKAVEAAQKAADDADAAAKAAQSTADTAKTNAANAQTAANNAKTAADNAKKAADEAQEAADKAQDDVDSLKIRVTAAETEIVKSNEQIAMRATKTEVEAIQIGGRNLAVGTSGEWTDISVNLWDGKLYHRTPTNPNNNKFHAIADYGFAPGDVVTFSIDLKAMRKRLAMRVDCYDSDGAVHDMLYGTIIEVGETGRSVLTFKIADYCASFDVLVGTDASVSGTTTEQYKCFKIEKGSKATDWTPAPEDIDSKFLNYYTKTETDAELSIMSGNISAAVSRVAGVESRTTQLELDTNGITTRVSAVENMEIGGRNLLLNSSFQENVDKWNGINNSHIVTKDGVACAHIQGGFNTTLSAYQSILAKIDPNDTEQIYTCSLDVRLDNYVAGTTNPFVQMYFSGLYNSNGVDTWLGATSISGNPYISSVAGQGWVRLKYTFRFARPLSAMAIYVFARDFTGDLYFKNYKLEKGSKATDWTPAPEDVEADIEEQTGEVQKNVDGVKDRVDIAESAIQQLKDAISMLVTDKNGTSLMVQTSEGWTFSTGAIQEAVDKASESLGTLQGEMGDTKSAVDALESAVEDLGVLSEYIKIGTHTYVDHDDVNLLAGISPSDATGGGVTFDWTGNSCKISGTSTAEIWTAFSGSINTLPPGIVAGKTYYVKHNSNAIEFRVVWYNSAGAGITMLRTFTDATFTIPADAVGVQFRYQRYESGITFNETLIPAVYAVNEIVTEPCIDLGEHDTGFKLKITNTKILFTDGSTELVSINSKNKSLEIGKATIKNELQFGDEENVFVPGIWIWKQRSNGNLGLMWKGVNE